LRDVFKALPLVHARLVPLFPSEVYLLYFDMVNELIGAFSVGIHLVYLHPHLFYLMRGLLKECDEVAVVGSVIRFPIYCLFVLFHLVLESKSGPEPHFLQLVIHLLVSLDFFLQVLFLLLEILQLI